jgi:hypothetical protein
MDSVAVTLDIPSWIIHLRHSVTHGSTVPSLQVIRSAATEIMENFIIPRYWDAQFEALPDVSTRSVGQELSDSESTREKLPFDFIDDLRNFIGGNSGDVITYEFNVDNSANVSIISHIFGSESIHEKEGRLRLAIAFSSLPSESAKTCILKELFRQGRFELIEFIFESCVITKSMRLEFVSLLCATANTENEFSIVSRLLSGRNKSSSDMNKPALPVSFFGKKFSADEFEM